MLSFHLPPAERGSPPQTSWCRPGAEAAILEKCRLFTYRQLSVAVHLEPVGADQVLLVEDCVVRTEEMEILELKQKPIYSKIKLKN
jgi:hypothetical protein